MKTLNHPNVLRALDVIVDGDRWHLVLELCLGPDVQAVLDVKGALLAEEARDVTKQCLRALRHLHGRGIVHHDVKPANVGARWSELRGLSLRLYSFSSLSSHTCAPPVGDVCRAAHIATTTWPQGGAGHATQCRLLWTQ